MLTKNYGKPKYIKWNVGLVTIKNLIKALAKSVIKPIGLTAETSAADAGIQKESLLFGNSSIGNFKQRS